MLVWCLIFASQTISDWLLRNVGEMIVRGLWRSFCLSLAYDQSLCRVHREEKKKKSCAQTRETFLDVVCLSLTQRRNGIPAKKYVSAPILTWFLNARAQ